MCVELELSYELGRGNISLPSTTKKNKKPRLFLRETNFLKEKTFINF